MGPPPPPRAQPPKAVTDSSFLEKLHAVEEELAVCMKPFQVRAQVAPPTAGARGSDQNLNIPSISSLCLSLRTTWA